MTRVQWALGLKDADIADVLGMSVSKMRTFRTQKSLPSSMPLFAFAEVFGLPMESLLSGNIDYKALSEIHHGNLEHVPDRYAEGAFSKRRAATPILSYLERNYGSYSLDRQLQYFQLHRQAFADPDSNISIRFLVDFCAHLTRFGFQETHFAEIGTYSVQANVDGPVGKAFGKLKSPGEVYESLVGGGLVSRFDENWDYSLSRLTETSATIGIKAKSEVLDKLKTKKIGSALLCALKGGVGASLPAYQGLPVADHKHVRCIHRGDSECIYEADFSKAAHASKRLRGNAKLARFKSIS